MLLENKKVTSGNISAKLKLSLNNASYLESSQVLQNTHP